MTADPPSVLTGAAVRAMCRTGRFTRPTAGAAPGFVQTNLVVLRAPLAGDFAAFCRVNPKPCPLLEVTEPGAYEPKRMAPGADVRTDLPRYHVYCDGVLIDRPASIEAYWTDDCVAFLIGCSFTFETALLEAGLPVRHIQEGCNVPMYRTRIPCAPAGPFAGPLVVSMRPMTQEQSRLAERITAAMPYAHGAPIHVGDPLAIGVQDLASPDYGDTVTIHRDEIPVFWACGVTPVEAIMHVRPDLAITHAPGHMLVTDVMDHQLHEIRQSAGD